MRVKKWLAPLLGLTLLFGLAACGGGRTAPQASSEAAADSAPPAEATAQTDRSGDAPAEQAGSGTWRQTARFSGAVTDDGLQERTDEPKNEPEKTLRLRIGVTEVCVAWEDNESVEALIALAEKEPLTVGMSMYGGFEQVGPLGESLPRNDVQTTTESGDVVLYAGDRIVLFYGSNTWAYTRLGRITDRTAGELAELLGGGDVTITITYGG